MSFVLLCTSRLTGVIVHRHNTAFKANTVKDQSQLTLTFCVCVSDGHHTARERALSTDGSTSTYLQSHTSSPALIVRISNLKVLNMNNKLEIPIPEQSTKAHPHTQTHIYAVLVHAMSTLDLIFYKCLKQH